MRWASGPEPGDGVRLFVRRVVEPQAPAVVLLHGLGVSGSVFQPFARRLLPDLAAVVPDLRGHGDSDKPTSGYAPEDHAGDIAELISAQTPVGMVGHSLGALVAMHVAARRPELVRWLVLLDPPLDSSLRNGEISDVYGLRHAAAGELEAYLLERNPRGGRLLADALARDFRRAADAAFEAFLDVPSFAVLRVAAPTLLVQADPSRGGVLGDDAARAAVTALGNARLMKIDRAPHAVHASHPTEVASAIRGLAAER